MPYDNIKSLKKPGFNPLFRRYIFQKISGGVKLSPPAVLGLKNKIYKYITLVLKTFILINQMVQLEKNNNTYRSTIKMKPEKIDEDPKFKIGYHARIY